MLTCFSLQNVFKGLMLVASHIFKQEKLILNTLFVNLETGQTERCKGFQLYPSRLQALQAHEFPLIEVIMDQGGTVYMDIFNRPDKLYKNLTQTLTEQGSSKVKDQRPVAFLIDALPINT